MRARGGIRPREKNTQNCGLTHSKAVMHVEHALWSHHAKYGAPAMSVTLSTSKTIPVRCQEAKQYCCARPLHEPISDDILKVHLLHVMFYKIIIKDHICLKLGSLNLNSILFLHRVFGRVS